MRSHMSVHVHPCVDFSPQNWVSCWFPNDLNEARIDDSWLFYPCSSGYYAFFYCNSRRKSLLTSLLVKGQKLNRVCCWILIKKNVGSVNGIAHSNGQEGRNSRKNTLSDMNQTKWTSVIRHLHVTIACYHLTVVDWRCLWLKYAILASGLSQEAILKNQWL